MIDGEDQEKIFTVEVEKTENVTILKDRIKEEAHLNQVDASDLDLWWLSVRMNLEQNSM